MIGQLKDNRVKLKRIFIEAKLPEALEPLDELAGNLWWTWNQEATELFHSIDPDRFEELNYNAVALLKELSPETTRRLVADQDFMARLKAVEKAFNQYLKEKPKKGSPRIAYFSMEYGLHISLRLYSGGLGVLAGDYLKEASDDNADLVAVGLLYRYGYFNQSVSLHGDQINDYQPQEFTKLPIKPVRTPKGDWLRIQIGLHGRIVLAKVWELKVGRISLYLLDTDIDDNKWEDRTLTHQLYGGDNEHRLRQEILLGIGGIRALKELGIEADVYHCNEGHAAFFGLERLKNLIQDHNLSFDEALQVVRATSLFTTHTPVPAGHDYFPEGLLKSYLYQYAYDLGISWERFMALGKVNPDHAEEPFSMSNLAIRLSQEVNGVSKIHGAVSRKMFNTLYPGYGAEELFIGHVTNSVHYPTWIAREWNDLYVDTFGAGFLRDQSNKEYWRKIHGVADERIVDIRNRLKKRLLDYIRRKLQADFTRRGENPRAIFEVLNKINDQALVFGFARRFATYKRAHLLFTNLDRLRAIVNNPSRPVMFIFAGKAHPADAGGQGLIRNIVHVASLPEFAGKILFLEDYNMEMAKLLVQGVDVWLNFPTRPQEASGTSGMKAALNGVLNFSVLDGWWAEGYRPDAGWALSQERTYQDQSLQNELDAETIYNILEYEIVPAYFEQPDPEKGRRWIARVKQNIAEIAPQFTMKRMLDDYFDHFYTRLTEQGKKVGAQKFRHATELADWKARMIRDWDNLELVEARVFDSDNHPLPLGQPFEATLRIFLNGLNAKHVGVEVLFFKRLSENELRLQFIHELNLSGVKEGMATYSCSVDPHLSGVYEYGFRAFPKHELMPHRQELNLVRWLG